MSDTNRPEPSHDEIRSRLSAWLDDDLDESRRRMVSEHLEGCGACRALLGDLERIREEARALPPREPEEDLWPGIRAAMEGTVEGGEHQDGAGAATARRGLFLTLPQLAAAALVVLAVGVSGGWWLAPVASAGSPAGSSPSPLRATGGPPSDGAGPGSTGTEGAAVPVALPAEVRELGKEAEGLRADFRERSRALDGRTVRTVDENLAVIDRAIREAEAAYARSPGNAFLERHLVESYRRKVTHLRDAVAVTSWSADE